MDDTREELFTVEMKHTEDTLMKLSHMQYDLFCKKNLLVRTAIAAVCIVLGAQRLDQWWALLLIGYGGYLLTSKYASANHTAHKLYKQFSSAGENYPYSRYIFEKKRMRIITMPENSELEPLKYSEIFRLGEDRNAFYIFQSQYGGYMIPKSSLGEREDEFKEFIQAAAKQPFTSRRTRFAGLRLWMKRREDEPYHL